MQLNERQLVTVRFNLHRLILTCQWQYITMKQLVSGPVVARVLGISHRRFLHLADMGVFQPVEREGVTVEEILTERDAFYQECGDAMVTRIELADRLGISPNRVSELVRMGVLEPASLDPLLYSLEHNQAAYSDYQDWLTHRKSGERYASPVAQNAADFRARDVQDRGSETDADEADAEGMEE
jgi:hypothetical protein